jgi:hypothetical protein
MKGVNLKLSQSVKKCRKTLPEIWQFCEADAENSSELTFTVRK